MTSSKLKVRVRRSKLEVQAQGSSSEVQAGASRLFLRGWRGLHCCPHGGAPGACVRLSWHKDAKTSPKIGNKTTKNYILEPTSSNIAPQNLPRQVATGLWDSALSSNLNGFGVNFRFCFQIVSCISPSIFHGIPDSSSARWRLGARSAGRTINLSSSCICYFISCSIRTCYIISDHTSNIFFFI